MTDPANVVIIMSDQHGAHVTGCYGNKTVATPHLDELAARGTMFTAAYATSPICVPSRSSFATGRYVHELELWDNDLPYTGSEAPSWGEQLVSAGHPATTIGKLHWSAETQVRSFPDQRIPIHLVPNVQVGFLRDRLGVRSDSRRHVERAGPGESEYTRYDVAVADRAVQWLFEEAPRLDAPWALFVSLVTPHFPLLSPPELFDRYPLDDVPLPAQWREEEWPRHPALDLNRNLQDQDRPFTEAEVRRATAAYYGLTTFMDAQVGRVVRAVRAAGFGDRTRIVYTSDHGDSLGAHGLWWKSNMYEEAVRVPLLLVGPDVPAGVVRRTPVDLADIHPTVLASVASRESHAHPGRESLVDIANAPDRDRMAFSEYHDAYSRRAMFMVRTLGWKYVHYVEDAPQLFDLEADPLELTDLAADDDFGDVLRGMGERLHEIVDPEETDRRARASQERRIEARGGVEAILRNWTHTYTPVPDEFSPDNFGSDDSGEDRPR